MSVCDECSLSVTIWKKSDEGITKQGHHCIFKSRNYPKLRGVLAGKFQPVENVRNNEDSCDFMQAKVGSNSFNEQLRNDLANKSPEELRLLLQALTGDTNEASNQDSDLGDSEQDSERGAGCDE